MASTSEEAGRAIGEIATSVSEVAAGAERQVRSMESATTLIEGVASATAQSAATAQETAAAAADARRVAQEGADAVRDASDAMTAVREASQHATAAIRQLGIKSERIDSIVATTTGRVPHLAPSEDHPVRAEAGRDPHDRNLSDLVGELSTRSEDFRVRWAAHNVRSHQTGAKRFHHPVVGDLSLTFEMLELTADPGLNLLAYSAEPGSTSQDALSLLGSWAATVEPATTHATSEA